MKPAQVMRLLLFQLILQDPVEVMAKMVEEWEKGMEIVAAKQ